MVDSKHVSLDAGLNGENSVKFETDSELELCFLVNVNVSVSRHKIIAIITILLVEIVLFPVKRKELASKGITLLRTSVNKYLMIFLKALRRELVTVMH